jgi:magnesium transporter
VKLAKSEEELQESLALVTEALERHRVLEQLAVRQEATEEKREVLQSLAHRQNVVELRHRLRPLHPADLAYILEMLPPEDRRTVWCELEPEKAAEVLLEVPRGVRDDLLEATGRRELAALLRHMDPEDLAYVAESVPADVLSEVSEGLGQEGASRLRAQQAWPEGSVGHLMSADVLAVRESATVEEVLLTLRQRREIPSRTDELVVTDARNVLRGLVPLQALLTVEPGRRVSEAMRAEVVAFAPDDSARQAVAAFDRYGLHSAPVVDERGKLLGRLTVDAVLEWDRSRAEMDALKRAGLAGDEDLFGSVWESARNRWPWLAINLVTAFVASRVIGLFEATIAELVALATLMPIVASVGGNTGNQTVALVIRGLALGTITAKSGRRLVLKELTISLLNGVVWGGVMGLFAFVLYRNPALSLVMAAAIVLNLIVAALVGIAVPLYLARSGRDPAAGSSVLLTFTTDGMGFFIFLGLARAFLMR